MGVEWDYCLEVGKLVGLKVVCSELLAMQKLGDSISEGLLDVRTGIITNKNPPQVGNCGSNSRLVME